MAESDVMSFAFGSFALVEGFEFEIGLAGAKGSLEEGGAQGFHAALAHFGLAFPWAAFFEARVVAHVGLESGGGLAVVRGVENFAREVSQDSNGGSGTEARH
jgi:hypothetical protein